MGCVAVESGRILLMFQRNIVFLSSGSKSKPSKKQAPLLSGCLLVLLFDPEDGGSTFLRNVVELLLDYTCHIPDDSTLPTLCRAPPPPK
jgi:hypothetical protein